MFDMSLIPEDAEMVEAAVNIGIDSRLEGFTKSKFAIQTNHEGALVRLDCQIHLSEMQILIRRLLESGDIHAEMLADDIVFVEYDCEPLP